MKDFGGGLAPHAPLMTLAAECNIVEQLAWLRRERVMHNVAVAVGGMRSDCLAK